MSELIAPIISCVQPVTSDRIAIEWEPVTGISYSLFARGYFNNQENYSYVCHQGILEGSFELVGCKPNGSVQVYVTATDGAIVSTASHALSITNAPSIPQLSIEMISYHNATVEILCPGALACYIRGSSGELVATLGVANKNEADVFSYSFVDLLANTENRFFITCSSHQGDIINLSQQSNLIFNTLPKPVSPQAIFISAVTSESLIVSWEAVVDAEGYEVLVDGMVRTSLQQTTLQITNLSANTLYSIAVAAVGSGGAVAPSLPQPVLTQIAAPGRPIVDLIGADSIRILGSTVDGATAYQFYLNGEAVFLGHSPRFTYDGLVAGETYDIGYSALKEQYETAVVVVTATTIVLPPTGIHVSNTNWNSFQIEWNDILGATSYRIYLFTNNDYVFIGEVSEPRFTHTNIAPMTTYVIALSALKNTIESGKSEHQSITTRPPPPSVPANPRLVTANEFSLVVAWDSVLDYDNDLTYNVFLNGLLHDNVESVSYTFDGLKANASYIFAVSAKTAFQESERTTNIILSTLVELLPPDNVIAVPINSNTINITWDESEGATSYIVEINGEKVEVEGNSYIKTDATENTNYLIKIYSQNSSGQSNSSLFTLITTPYLMPSAPGNFQTTSVSSYGFVLSWEPVVDAYSYEVSVDGIKFQTQARTVTVEGRQPDTKYYVTVQGLTVREDSGIASLFVRTRLMPPKNIRALMVTTSKIKLAWDAVFGATSYRVITSRDDLDNVGQTIDETRPITGTLATDISGLLSATSYRISVYAIASSGLLSDSGSILTVNTLGNIPNTPTGLMAAIVTKSSFQVSWNSVSGALSYNVYLNGEIAGNALIPLKFYNFQGLASGESYKVAVSTVGEDGESGLSTEITVTTSVEAPIEILALREDSHVVVSWQKVSNAVAYQFYYKTSYSGEYAGTGLSVGLSGFNQASPILISSSSYFETEDGRLGTMLYDFVPNTPYWLGLSAINAAGVESAITEYSHNFTWANESVIGITSLSQQPIVTTIFNQAIQTVSIRWHASSGD